MQTNPLPNGTTLKNRYRITRLVAGGGMAWVYKVDELLPNGGTREWALKELRRDSDDGETLEEARRLFEQEANILVRLSHPNLPVVKAFFEEDGRLYLVMEFINGESLKKRLDRANAPILEGEVLDWMVQICQVLTYLHTQSPPVIFRDMKPSNVMVTMDGRIKLIDFGIARTYKVGKRKDTVTMGSENYAAPEQWGEAQTDARADIYGLGATMYHLLTNVPPLPAFVPTPRVPIQQYNPAITEATVAVVEKALSEDREKRYATVAEMQEALLGCLPKREQRRLIAQRERDYNEWAARLRAGTRPQAQPSAPVQARPASPAPAPANRPQPAPAVARPTQAAVPTGHRPAPTQSTVSASEKVCLKCRTSNRREARFCRRCGHNFVPPPPPVLRVLEPVKAQWEFPLRGSSSLIGRKNGAQPVDLDLGFYDPEGYVSRNHARIVARNRRYYVTDLDSSNGTTLNGQPLPPNVERPLRHGDKLVMGRVVLQFRLG